MTILGIDPGTARCGWGVIKTKNSNNWEVINYGCIETHKSLSMPERLEIISQEINKVIAKYKPEKVAIEKLFFGINVKTALEVGQARGAILVACQQVGLAIFEYTPLQIKMALTGYGRADKNQIQCMVKMLLKLDKIPKPDDAADGLAVALTCGFQNRIMR